MPSKTVQHMVVLALDVGNVRIGVARAHTFARLPEPVAVINRTTEDAFARIQQLAVLYNAEKLVIGLPSHINGTEGQQALAVRDFVKELANYLPLKQVFVDESYTSIEADAYLQHKRWKNQPTNDALAACMILQRFFSESSVNV